MFYLVGSCYLVTPLLSAPFSPSSPHLSPAKHDAAKHDAPCATRVRDPHFGHDEKYPRLVQFRLYMIIITFVFFPVFSSFL